MRKEKSTGDFFRTYADISAAYSRKYYDVQDHAVATPMFSVFFHGYCNPRWLDGLNAEQRAALEAASAAAAEAAVAKTESSAAEAPDQLRGKGMQVHIHTPAEMAAFKAAMLPAFDAEFDKSTGGTGKALLESIERMTSN